MGLYVEMRAASTTSGGAQTRRKRKAGSRCKSRSLNGGINVKKAQVATTPEAESSAEFETYVVTRMANLYAYTESPEIKRLCLRTIRKTGRALAAHLERGSGLSYRRTSKLLHDMDAAKYKGKTRASYCEATLQRYAERLETPASVQQQVIVAWLLAYTADTLAGLKEGGVA
jgi:hypothetical protein